MAQLSPKKGFVMKKNQLILIVSLALALLLAFVILNIAVLSWR